MPLSLSVNRPKDLFDISNPEDKVSENETEQINGNFNRHTAYVCPPDQHNQIDSGGGTTNTQLLKQSNLLHERTTKSLRHTFDHSENSLKAKKAIQGALPTAGTVFLGTTAITAGALAITGTAGIAIPAVVAGEIVLGSAILGYIRGVRATHKYFIHEQKWFQHLVDKDHMKLFLKEVPEENDIKDLELFVEKISEKLSDENFNETYQTIIKALGFKLKNRAKLKSELKTESLQVLTVYLELAKQRYAENNATQVIYSDERQHTRNENSNGTPDGPEHLSDAMKNLQESLKNTSKTGIINPIFRDDDI